MPRAVRNWWVEGYIDGRETPLVGGPRSKDGGLMLRLYQRDNGSVREALRISAIADGGDDGVLTLEVRDGEGIARYTLTTTR